jgi:hypothetical protein
VPVARRCHFCTTTGTGTDSSVQSEPLTVPLSHDAVMALALPGPLAVAAALADWHCQWHSGCQWSGQWLQYSCQCNLKTVPNTDRARALPLARPGQPDFHCSGTGRTGTGTDRPALTASECQWHWHCQPASEWQRLRVGSSDHDGPGIRVVTFFTNLNCRCRRTLLLLLAA